MARGQEVEMLVAPQGVDAVLEARWLEPGWAAEVVPHDLATVRVRWRRR